MRQKDEIVNTRDQLGLFSGICFAKVPSTCQQEACEFIAADKEEVEVSEQSYPTPFHPSEESAINSVFNGNKYECGCRDGVCGIEYSDSDQERFWCHTHPNGVVYTSTPPSVADGRDTSTIPAFVRIIKSCHNPVHWGKSLCIWYLLY